MTFSVIVDKTGIVRYLTSSAC